jgi:hypothetical protein
MVEVGIRLEVQVDEQEHLTFRSHSQRTVASVLVPKAHHLHRRLK